MFGDMLTRKGFVPAKTLTQLQSAPAKFQFDLSDPKVLQLNLTVKNSQRQQNREQHNKSLNDIFNPNKIRIKK